MNVHSKVQRHAKYKQKAHYIRAAHTTQMIVCLHTQTHKEKCACRNYYTYIRTSVCTVRKHSHTRAVRSEIRAWGNKLLSDQRTYCCPYITTHFFIVSFIHSFPATDSPPLTPFYKISIPACFPQRYFSFSGFFPPLSPISYSNCLSSNRKVKLIIPVNRQL